MEQRQTVATSLSFSTLPPHPVPRLRTSFGFDDVSAPMPVGAAVLEPRRSGCCSTSAIVYRIAVSIRGNESARAGVSAGAVSDKKHAPVFPRALISTTDLWVWVVSSGIPPLVPGPVSGVLDIIHSFRWLPLSLIRSHAVALNHSTINPVPPGLSSLSFARRT